MNRVMLMENILALATVAILGPGTSVLIQQAVKQALALAKPVRGQKALH